MYGTTMRILGAILGILIAITGTVLFNASRGHIESPPQIPSSPSTHESKKISTSTTVITPPRPPAISSVAAAKPKAPAESTISKITNKAVEIVKEVSLAPPLIHSGTSGPSTLTYDGVFVWTNVNRHISGVSPPFTRNETLNQIAQQRAEDMFEKQYFEHTSPSGSSASTIADENGYKYIAIGENIALGNFDSDQDLVTAWMNSPGHRANILSPKFIELGVAVVPGVFNGRKTWIGVQIFGKPLSYCPQPDYALKTTIEQNRNQIRVYDGKLKGLNDELESLRARNPIPAEEYNQKVAEYNTLVNLINPLNVETKRIVDVYNDGVDRFNHCVTE